jgi:putative GTP pyrophosphokinase
MDDLVGCRITVPDRHTQNRARRDLGRAFGSIRWIDRNEKPSNGYRAVHGSLRKSGAVLEIQIRTTLQDIWANLSESFADRFGDPSIKYGGGPSAIRAELDLLSAWIDDIDKYEASRTLERMTAPSKLADDSMDEEILLEVSKELDKRMTMLRELHADAESRIARLRDGY